MINTKDVIRMKVPYPSVNAGLAVAAHMYICKTSASPKYEYIKCQTLKPYMLTGTQMTHYRDEQPDITRNPFQRPTRIDCDKVFATSSVEYSDGLKTTNRPDVCDSLFRAVLTELNKDGYSTVNVNETELEKLNVMVTTV